MAKRNQTTSVNIAPRKNKKTTLNTTSITHVVANQKSQATAFDLDQLLARVKKAQREFAKFPQEKVDKIFFKAAEAANQARILLAKEAVLETGRGLIEDKVIKNHFAAEFIYNKYRDAKTCDEIYYDAASGIRKIAAPVGVIAGVTPVTNPTSTTIFKALIALKTRNAIVFCPHPSAKDCSAHAARIVLEAAISAGAPKDIIGWIPTPTVELSQQLMQHRDVALILATGGPGMVKSAYSSGTPAIGVGAGNTPAIIDETADIQTAVSSILISKTFDYGMICASEQSVVAMESVYNQVKEEFLRQGAYILSKKECEKLGRTVVVNGKLNPDIVGHSAYKIAELANINVPETTKVLIGEVSEVGINEPLSFEKLSPVLGLYSVKDFASAVDKAEALVEFGGLGHTSVLYTNDANQDRIEAYGKRMKTNRILINMPASQGAIGDVYNFRLEPSLTLGCGSQGNNSVSENVGAKHLINIKTVAERRENTLWFRVPQKVYFKRNCLPEALKDLAGRKRAFIVTDRSLYDLGYVNKVTEVLENYGIQCEVFSEVKPDPDLSTVEKGVARMREFQPDTIITLGGGSPIDAGKVMWLMYELPEINFEEIAMRFMDIRKRVYKLPELGKKATFVAIPTTSGTGSEVTPFAVITDDKTGIKYPIADYALTPNMAIIDPDFVMQMPKSLTAAGGIDAITHALEAYVATTASPYSNAMALDALKLLFKYLPKAYKEGANNPFAREQVHYAATMAGMAFANGFLGICHSLAHKLGAAFHIAHGVANALMIIPVIKFNATDAPRKQGVFSQYRTPDAMRRYAEIADALRLGGNTQAGKVEKLIIALDKIQKELDLPATIQDAGVNEEDFYAKLEEMSELAFDDQCTGTNPRYPSIEEMKELYIEAYHGADLSHFDLEAMLDTDDWAAK